MILSVLAAIVLGVGIAVIVRWYRSKVRKIQDISQTHRQKLEETGHELDELRRVFEINCDEINLKDRIDKVQQERK